MTLDRLIIRLDKILRVAAGDVTASRTNPGSQIMDCVLNVTERQHSAGLMRVNHVGEVCAQALYEAQGIFAHDAAVRQQFVQAGVEEEDHLAWTAQRLHELNARPSLLNPLWYAGAFAVGMTVARFGGDARSLGFVVETERQVGAHLAGHLDALPIQDAKSRAIVEQMAVDEAAHAKTAAALGAVEPPVLVQKVMQGMARIMTTTAYYL